MISRILSIVIFLLSFFLLLQKISTPSFAMIDCRDGDCGSYGITNLTCPPAYSQCPQPGPADCATGDTCPYNACTGGSACCSGNWQHWTLYHQDCALYQNTSCEWIMLLSNSSCSIGDKCIKPDSPVTGPLRSGQCTCGSYGDQYKTCCDTSTWNMGVCNAVWQDGYWPPEGYCPSGSQPYWCNLGDGGGSYPACGQTACDYYAPPITISGRVTDTETGAGISGVIVTISDSTRGVNGSATTDGNGNWSNNTIVKINNNYSVSVPIGAGSRPCNAGYICDGSGTSPSPVSRNNCLTSCNFTYTPGKISGHVWIDNDHDGVQNNGEPNASNGVLVQLNTGAFYYTDASGNYSFDYLSTGTYTVSVHDFQGYKTITGPQTLALPPNRVNINFGIAPAYAITGRVFTDYNYNGVDDAEDVDYAPPPGVNVIVKDSGGSTVATIPVIARNALPVQNGSFETASGSTGCGNGMSNWFYAQGGSGVGCMNQDCSTAAPGAGSCSLKINATVTSSDYNVDAYQVGIPITNGTAYQVTFSAKAQSPRSMTAGVVELNSPWINYFSTTENLTTSWTQYSFTFTPDYTDNNGRLIFGVGSVANNPVWIDNVYIYPMSYAVQKLYNGNYTLSLSPLPVNTAESPPVPLPATVSNADNNSADLGISPLYRVQGQVYIDANKDTCYEPAYDPLYAPSGTVVSFKDSNNVTTTYNVVSGSYNTGITLHAGTYTVTYAIPATYDASYPPVGFSIVVGTPGKSVHCDVTLAENVLCW